MPRSDYKSKLVERKLSGGPRHGKLQTQGLHHITLVGADRQTSIDFWEGVLGMPFMFEQPNLDNPLESHIYFDPGDGRLITIFTREDRKPDPRRTPTEPGCVHHIAIQRLARQFHAGGRAARRARRSSTPACAIAGFSTRSISRIRSAC